MLNTVEKFLEKYNLNTSEHNVLVGFSGGYDSMCLLNVLNQLSLKYKFKLVALHLNHNWRGEESKQEELNCKKFCKKHNVEFVSKTLTGDIQKTEISAREARYEFFEEQANLHTNSSIFTAHTASDNAETLIYRIAKGTGTVGLQGIMQKRMLNKTPVYRPLLDFSRCDIENYCNSNGLIPNQDSSNLDVKYQRNFIRHKIMPLLKEINPQAENAINNLSEIAISQNNIVNEYIANIIKDISVENECSDCNLGFLPQQHNNWKILTAKFHALSIDVKQKIIYDLCIEYDLDYDRKKIKNILEFINENINSKSGSRFSLTNNLWLFVSAEYIYPITQVNAEKNLEKIQINNCGVWKLGSGKAFSLEEFTGELTDKFPSENALFAYVDLSEVGTNFTLRTRREGDFITPFGMTGSMKLKKYLTLKNIPQHEKDSLVLLCKGSEILWVIGVGLSNKLKVKNIPTHILKFK